ncbi:MAG: rRNA maturation RNase YbeY [Vicinamibacteria bacterium]|nr:rRNA maturation RNase YbeY [Vicinamibacteria bacterium]
MLERRRSARRIRVTILNRQRRRRISAPGLRSILELAAAMQDVQDLEMTLVLGGDRLLGSLNARFRRSAYPTDVLAFVAEGNNEPGDVVINVEAAARQARQRGHSLRSELAVLAIHGLLHLLGHDHETDGGRMRRLETRIRRRLLLERPNVGRRRVKNRACSVP